MVNTGLEEGIIYCLIFMDLSMPIMDGYEAAEAIRDSNTAEMATSSNVSNGEEDTESLDE